MTDLQTMLLELDKQGVAYFTETSNPSTNIITGQSTFVFDAAGNMISVWCGHDE